MGVRKPFDKSLYREYDGKGKRLVAKWLTEHGYIVYLNEAYKADLVVKAVSEQAKQNLFSAIGGDKVLCEVEIKRPWASGKFPFFTVDIPERKQAYLNKGLPVYFWVISDDCQRAMVINGKHLIDTYLHEKSNKYVAKGESFFQIPTNLCKELDLNT